MINKKETLNEQAFFNKFTGVDEINVPYSKVIVQYLQFDVNLREYKEIDNLMSVEAIVHGTHSANNTRLEITFNPKLRSEIRKMKHFIKSVENSKEKASMTQKPDVINIILQPTRIELAGSQIVASNPRAIDIEEHGFLFNKNLTVHLIFPKNNVFMTINYDPQKTKENNQNIKVNKINSKKTSNQNISNNQNNINSILEGNEGEANKNPNEDNSLQHEEEGEKEPMTQREAEELAEDDMSYNKLIGSDNPQKDLDELIGLENVKSKIKQMESRMLFEKKKREAGIKETRASNRHMIFYGEPGTGKTTVARIMTGILYNMGLIRKNQCIEVNGEMLKGKFMGASAPKTQRMVNRAMGGVLFIDEAYTIMDNFSSGGGYGKEVISVLLKAMEDHKDDLIIIFAGYEQEMEDFLDTNPGLKSRIGDKIEFIRYQPEALIDIFDLMLQDHGLNITYEAHIELFNSLFDAYNNGMTSGQNGNARYIENLTEKVVDLHAYKAVDMDADDPNMFVVQKDTIEELFIAVPQTLEEHEYMELDEDIDPKSTVY